ncbi:hypothetical protein [Neptunicella sp.]|uniref:hypothetical protein n=1 Tax=Neptunicella sp. TaxID=2125986 RepID=UPI003F6933FE
MNTVIRIGMHGLRWLSATSVVLILFSGFWLELSFSQMLIFNPLLLLLAVSLFAYSGFKLDNESEGIAEIHHLDHYFSRSNQEKTANHWKRCG